MELWYCYSDRLLISNSGNYDIILGGTVNGTLNSTLPLLPAYSYTVTYPNVANTPSVAVGINSYIQLSIV